MKEYQIAFVGNPNVGKSAWINALSGADFKVGNWPGVTIEKKEARVIWKEEAYHLIDLPGTYALDKVTNEERITTQYLREEPVDLIVNVVDATNLSRNLYLTLCLRELQIPMLLVLNFMDEVDKYHIRIETEKLSRRLQLPVLPYSALDKEHYDDVQEAICMTVHNDVCFAPLLDGEDARRYYDLCTYLERYMPQEAKTRDIHKLAVQIIHKEEIAYRQLVSWHRSWEELDAACHPFDEEQWQRIYQRTLPSLMRYVHEEEADRLRISQKIDHCVLHKYWGFPICFLFFSVVLMIVFNGSAPFNDFIDFFINQMLAKYTAAAISFLPVALQQLILKGILAGVGGVLTFVPLMALLYFMLALLEESGYMSRIAFLFDRSMRVFHLSGKSFVSLLLGFGCNVPAIYATRTLDNEKQKKLTALLVPFMSCGARLPVYVLFASAFFQGKAAVMILSIYGIGILLALIMALVYSRMKGFRTKGLFVLELPPYRLPSMSVVFQKVKQEVKAYVHKATTIVLWAMIALWALSYFPNGSTQDSYIARFGKLVAPIYEPLGFGTRWETVAALPGSIIAKETVVGFLDQMLLNSEEEPYEPISLKEDIEKTAFAFGSACRESVTSILPRQVLKEGEDASLVQAVHGLWTDRLANLRAFSYMVYVLLSIPCVMTLQAVYREYGRRLLLLSILTMLFVPYLVSLFIFQFFSLIL